MCGRISLTSPTEAVLHHFDLLDLEPFPPRYNIAPTQPILIVRHAVHARGSNQPPRSAGLVRWGLIPSWAKDPADLPLLINARSETAADKASFRGPMRHGRILVPANGFYEWKRGSGTGSSRPYWIAPPDGRPFAFAGLYSALMAVDGSEIETACILTTAANDDLRPIHDRVPVVIEPDDYDRWMDCTSGSVEPVADLLSAPADGFFEAVPVSRDVNKVSNDHAGLQERVEDDAGETSDAPPRAEQLPLL